jgi:flagellin
MANIGATTAFYKVETSLTRANSEVSKSMERLATGKANANVGDRSSYVAMADTFRLDFVGTKAGIKGASVVMGYLETGMRVLDSASALLSRLQELAVLGANDTNTTTDHEAINLEAEAIAQEFNRLMSTNSYKGKNVFVDTAGSEYVSMGGRESEMTFGIGKIDYSELFGIERTVQAGFPNAGNLFNLTDLPSDGVVEPNFSAVTLKAGKTYELTNLPSSLTDQIEYSGKLLATGATTLNDVSDLVVGTKFTVTSETDLDLTITSDTQSGTNPTLKKGEIYKVISLNVQGGGPTTDVSFEDSNDTNAFGLASCATALNGNILSGDMVIGTEFLIAADYTITDNNLALKRVTKENRYADGTFGEVRKYDTSTLISKIENIQGKINTARVQAGSQYAALESAITYTTDLTAQYELGYNTVNDVNFSMETAHLAKNQILQQAATAMLAQANQGQQGLLQLIS